MLAGGFGPPKAQGAGDLQSPGIDHYPKLAYQKLFVGLREFQLLSGLPPFALQGYLLLRFKCGPHCHTNKFVPTGNSVHASALFYSLHDSNIRIKPVELAETILGFVSVVLVPFEFIVFGLHYSFYYLTQPSTGKVPFRQC